MHVGGFFKQIILMPENQYEFEGYYLLEHTRKFALACKHFSRNVIVKLQ